MGPAERQYYRETWGFDPIDGLHRLGQDTIWVYEAGYELAADPALIAAGVSIHAQVSFNFMELTKKEWGIVRNKIVFRAAGGREAAVTCTHTVVYQGNVEVATDWAANPPASTNLLGPAILPPWEHFVALKSYVAALAEVGIGNLLAAAHSADDNTSAIKLPFGFNAEMQSQIFRALQTVAPGATRALQRDWLMGLIEVASVKWLIDRRALLNEIAPIPDLLKEIEDLAGDWVATYGDKIAALRGNVG